MRDGRFSGKPNRNLLALSTIEIIFRMHNLESCDVQYIWSSWLPGDMLVCPLRAERPIVLQALQHHDMAITIPRCKI